MERSLGGKRRAIYSRPAESRSRIVQAGGVGGARETGVEEEEDGFPPPGTRGWMDGYELHAPAGTRRRLVSPSAESKGRREDGTVGLRSTIFAVATNSFCDRARQSSAVVFVFVDGRTCEAETVEPAG